MRVHLAVSAFLLGSLTLSAQAPRRAAKVVLDNTQVRVLETSGSSFNDVGHAAAVVVFIEDSSRHKAGDAVWAADAAAAANLTGGASVVIVEPRRGAVSPVQKGDAGTAPGDAPFTGMSFHTLFENEQVTVIRARMDVGAREAFHTHGSDTVVVHLSGGSIEDTADGTTTVNRWKPGDVEFEGRGSSHSARNVAGAVDVVLVALKPQPAR